MAEQPFTPFVTGQWHRLSINITELMQRNLQKGYRYKYDWFVIQPIVDPATPLKIYLAPYVVNVSRNAPAATNGGEFVILTQIPDQSNNTPTDRIR